MYYIPYVQVRFQILVKLIAMRMIASLGMMAATMTIKLVGQRLVNYLQEEVVPETRRKIRNKRGEYRIKLK
jgi:hypothetical protein